MGSVQAKKKEKGRSTHTCNSTQTISSILRIAETKQITCNHIINAALFMLIEIQKVYFAITFFPDACRRILYIHTLIKIGNNKQQLYIIYIYIHKNNQFLTEKESIRGDCNARSSILHHSCILDLRESKIEYFSKANTPKTALAIEISDYKYFRSASCNAENLQRIQQQTNTGEEDHFVELVNAEYTICDVHINKFVV